MRGLLLALLVSSIIISTSACNINAFVVMEHVGEPGYAQFIFNNGSRSDKLPVSGKGGRERYDVQIVGDACHTSPTVLATYDTNGNLRGITSAYVEGGGSIEYHIHDNLSPHMHGRIGVFCAMGSCGRG